MENFSWKAVKLDCITITEILRCFREADLRIKNVLSWQNILSNRQIAAGIEEKWANQGKSPSSRNQSYLPFLIKWKPCHGAINSRSRNLRTALEKYFRFQWNCKQLQIEARNKFWYLLPSFLWNYTYNFENIFTAWS